MSSKKKPYMDQRHLLNLTICNNTKLDDDNIILDDCGKRTPNEQVLHFSVKNSKDKMILKISIVILKKILFSFW